MTPITLFNDPRPATLADGESVEVMGVTKADDGAALWVVRREYPDGESVLRCYSHIRFATGQRLAKAA